MCVMRIINLVINIILLLFVFIFINFDLQLGYTKQQEERHFRGVITLEVHFYAHVLMGLFTFVLESLWQVSFHCTYALSLTNSSNGVPTAFAWEGWIGFGALKSKIYALIQISFFLFGWRVWEHNCWRNVNHLK